MDFDDFWKICPRKVGKGAARKAFNKAVKDEIASAEEIINGMKAAAAEWRRSGTETAFIPHPATWINQERWDDEQEDEREYSTFHRDMAALTEKNPVPISLQIYERELLPEIMDRWRQSGFKHWWHVAARMKQAKGLADLRARVRCGLASQEYLDRAEAVYETMKLPPVLRKQAEMQERGFGDPAKHSDKQEAA